MDKMTRIKNKYFIDFKLPKTEITININAIKKIMLHTIEFSNPTKSNWRWKEVMGILGGKIKDENNIYVNDSFAITHGNHYSVQYNKKNYIIATQINDLLFKKNEFFVGWYHSHPGLGFFYSHTDIINHLGYQDVNPHAIGIVFDHKGYDRERKFFEIYKLRYSNYGYISYESVPYIIESVSKKDEIKTLKKIYDEILFYWKIGLVESAEKTIKKWLKEFKKM